MSNFRQDFTAAKARAVDLAAYFNVPFYVVATTAGFYVERDRPGDMDRALFIAFPNINGVVPSDPALLD